MIQLGRWYRGLLQTTNHSALQPRQLQHIEKGRAVGSNEDKRGALTKCMTGRVRRSHGAVVS